MKKKILFAALFLLLCLLGFALYNSQVEECGYAILEAAAKTLNFLPFP